MKRDHRTFPDLTCAAVTWDENGTPSASAFDDVYYSRDDGLRESEHTFLRGNNLPERWHRFTDPTFCIAETGFGTGLNFLLTWQAWLQTAEPKPNLQYVSLERFPLRADDLAQALAAWGTLAPLATTLLEHYPQPIPGCHRLLFSDDRVRLDLHLGDAADILGDLASQGRRWIDAWYLDGFAPSSNPTMWSSDLAGYAAGLSKHGATLATFTSAGTVRRGLRDAGFNVRKVQGFGRKREALRATWLADALDNPAPARPGKQSTAWDLAAIPSDRPKDAIVLGAGLAGCWTAYALAKRGIAVRVLDQNQVADSGSGNAQGVLYTRLSHRHSILTDFSLLSFCFATQRYRTLFQEGALQEGLDGALCGNLQLVAPDQDDTQLRNALADLHGLAQILDADAAEEKTGIPLPSGGYWFPAAGWLDPRAVCHALLAHPNITLQENCGPLTLRADANGWNAVTADGDTVHSAACAVIAAGTDAIAMTQLRWLPTRRIRGQTTQVPALTQLQRLRSALCHEGYVAPARAGEHCIGASFELDAAADEPSEREHAENVLKLSNALPRVGAELASIDTRSLSGRVGLRCASPDYLPIVGAVPDYPAFIETYSALRENARQTIAKHAPQLPGLYVSTAHGSRGLTSTPLAAELLASTICQEPPPLERSLGRAISPARFIIRDLARNKL